MQWLMTQNNIEGQPWMLHKTNFHTILAKFKSWLIMSMMMRNNHTNNLYFFLLSAAYACTNWMMNENTTTGVHIINPSLGDNINHKSFQIVAQTTMNNLVLVATLLLSSSLPVCLADERTSSVGWNKKVGPTNIKMRRLPRSWVQKDADAY